MPIARKSIDIPAEVAHRFVADMQAYHAEQDIIARDRIAVGTRHMLLDHMPAGTKLRLSEVKALFDQMRSIS
ncbi:hypothetical protein H8A95_39275 [Bradyrhizobium sp. Pear76]|uniref:hypothetical protein n=1 Tax=Bradyrhizobium oropedii TaxID=1571201 RepID=UPI001E55D608|nr:hypothetical protein [Bradyrhizobium oropedii]MCC8968190.1 hypothetical protein [Bradyrhizobium oropedii]